VQTYATAGFFPSEAILAAKLADNPLETGPVARIGMFEEKPVAGRLPVNNSQTSDPQAIETLERRRESLDIPSSLGQPPHATFGDLAN
jgi:hypothetical protein